MYVTLYLPNIREQCLRMSKEIINVVLPMKTYDTSKMDSWTDEQWKVFVGEEEDHVGIQLLLMNNHEFYLKITGIYYNELTKEFCFSFDTQNKLDKNIKLQFVQWKFDDIIYNFSHEKPLH